MKNKKLTFLLVLTLTIMVISSGTVLGFKTEPLPSGPTYKEVLVATVDDEGEDFDLRTNIYLPEDASEAPFPLLLYIHGHGGAYNFSNGSRAYELAIALKNRGIAVASVDYRPKSALPEDIYDVKGYVRWFRANADKYGIDPERIGIWGTSRGGHLASVLATSGDVEKLEGNVGGNLDQSSRVQCAAIYYPFTTPFLDPKAGTFSLFYDAKESDFPKIMEAYENQDTSSPAWKYVELAKLCNPINYVSEDDPPAFIAVGGSDNICPPVHDYKLFDEYMKKDVRSSLHIWQPGGHGQVGEDIEAATQDWLANKLLIELAE